MKSIKNVLLLNAISSGVTGLILITFPGMIASLFDVSEPRIFLSLGIFLVVFAVMVFSEGLKEFVRVNRVLMITLLDVLWVLGSIVVVLLSELSMMGYMLTVGIALWVAAMALLQWNGIQQKKNPS